MFHEILNKYETVNPRLEAEGGREARPLRIWQTSISIFLGFTLELGRENIFVKLWRKIFFCEKQNVVYVRWQLARIFFLSKIRKLFFCPSPKCSLNSIAHVFFYNTLFLSKTTKNIFAAAHCMHNTAARAK